MMGKDLSGNGREKVEPSLESGREASESVSSSAGVTAHDTSQSSPRQYTAMTTTLVLMPQSSAHTAQHQLISDEEAVHGSLAQFHDTSHAQPPPQPSPSTQPRGPFKAYPTQIYQRGQAPTLREPHLGEGMSVMPFRGHMIPDIVIEPIPPRDSFGHSHTPPLVQRQWSLSSPASGKKVRALSDSSIIDLEKTHRQMPEAQQHIPVRGFHSAHEFQTDLDTHPEKRSRGHDMDQSKIQLQGYGHKQPAWSTFYHHTSGEKRATGSPLPMEVDNTNNNKSTSESGKVASKPEMVREMEHSGYAHLQQTSVQVSQGVSVSSPPTSSASSASLSSSLAFHTPEKSPKMYWLRRHSDSHMPGTQSEEQMLTVSRGEASRSKSMGDADRMEKLPLGGDTQETETKETSERLDAIAHLRTSEKMSSTTPTTSIPKSPTGHTIFSERIKLKKYLQKRYQSSLDEESGLKEVNINRPKESERHSVEDVSSPLCTGASPEGMALDTPAQPTAMAPPSKKPPQLSLQETIPLKVEPISPPSESDTEAETPVFFSPSFISPRVFSESPRWHHGVFQFPATRSHQVSLHGTESRSHSGVESSSSTFVSLRSSPLETKDVTMEGPATSSEQHDEWVAGDKSIKDEESKSKAEVCQVTQEKLRSLSSVEGTHYTKGIPGTAHFSPTNLPHGQHQVEGPSCNGQVKIGRPHAISALVTYPSGTASLLASYGITYHTCVYISQSARTAEDLGLCKWRC
ncbi:hypothetical protein LSH36_361g08009 [Paralvinella palmiformis]|uniref:Uncharacterized protein n=1 Tax=Paralvinella palmiformis TaxID=53620 RepID=A0AAD9JE52_9ANNE|nr:hypothetical protein LSH36_361g08009 [Paralvinella palmiformis]